MMSFELLYQTMRRLNLTVTVDVLQFVVRLEALLSCLYDSNGIAWSISGSGGGSGSGGVNVLDRNEFMLRCVGSGSGSGSGGGIGSGDGSSSGGGNSDNVGSMIPPLINTTITRPATITTTTPAIYTTTTPTPTTSTVITAGNGFGIYPDALAALGKCRCSVV